MSVQEKQLLDLLVNLKSLETECKTLHTAIAVPPVVYETIDKLRSELARWGIECVVQERAAYPPPVGEKKE